jgi:pimeloyl-ACP methyl ester carboxylesterase
MKDPKNLTGGFNYYRAFSEDVKENQVFIETKIKVPVLGLGGDHSLWLIQNPTWSALAEKYAAVMIKNSGHYIVEENPDEVIKAITSFIDSL